MVRRLACCLGSLFCEGMVALPIDRIQLVIGRHGRRMIVPQVVKR